MSDELVIRQEKDGVLELVLNRNEKYNAINNAMFDDIQAAIEDMREREDLRVMLIRAKGKYFSAGVDVAVLATPDLKGSTSHFRRVYRSNARHDLYDAMESLEKPIIIAAHAPCLGAGLEMSLSCDFRLASESASYGLPEIDMGMIAGSGGTSRLVRTVGAHWARWLIMTGKTVEASQALNWGLVHEVYPDEELEDKAWDLARLLASKPPETLAISKVAIELVRDNDRQNSRIVERLVNSTLMFGKEREDMMSAMLARVQKSKKT